MQTNTVNWDELRDCEIRPGMMHRANGFFQGREEYVIARTGEWTQSDIALAIYDWLGGYTYEDFTRILGTPAQPDGTEHKMSALLKMMSDAEFLGSTRTGRYLGFQLWIEDNYDTSERY